MSVRVEQTKQNKAAGGKFLSLTSPSLSQDQAEMPYSPRREQESSRDVSNLETRLVLSTATLTNVPHFNQPSCNKVTQDKIKS